MSLQALQPLQLRIGIPKARNRDTPAVSNRHFKLTVQKAFPIGGSHLGPLGPLGTGATWDPLGAWTLMAPGPHGLKYPPFPPCLRLL